MTRIILYFTVLSVFTTISYCQKPRPLQRKPQNDFSFSNFVKQSFYYLNVKVLARSFENNPVLCWLKCLDVLSCFSVNVASSKDSESKFWCELLVTDKYNAPDKFLPNSSSHHYSISSQCEQIPCLHNGTCLPNYDDDTFTCICAVGYIGARCEKGCGFTAVGLHDSHIIPDSSFTASSFSNDKRLAHFARLNGQLYWVPSSASNAHGAWLQVDLLSKYTICAVATQGGTDPTYDTWITQYKLSLSTDGAGWEVYQENGADKVFPGNKDKRTVVKNFLSNKPSARYVRFLPIAWADYAGGRVEVYGTR